MLRERDSAAAQVETIAQEGESIKRTWSEIEEQRTQLQARLASAENTVRERDALFATLFEALPSKPSDNMEDAVRAVVEEIQEGKKGAEDNERLQKETRQLELEKEELASKL